MKFMATSVATITLIAACTPANAGQFQLQFSAFPVRSVADFTESIGSTTATVNSASSNIWNFSFGETQFLARFSVTVSNKPDGYYSAPYNLDIPYYLERSLKTVLATGASTDDTGWGGMSAFISAAHIPRDSLSASIMNQRARCLWIKQLKFMQDGKSPDRDDILVAYWLLKSTEVLVINMFIDIDDDTDSAISWLDSNIDEPDFQNKIKKIYLG